MKLRNWILAAALVGLSAAALAADCHMVRTSFGGASSTDCGISPATLPMPYSDSAASTRAPSNLVQQVVVMMPASGTAVDLPVPGVASAGMVKASPQATRRVVPHMTLSW